MHRAGSTRDRGAARHQCPLPAGRAHSKSCQKAAARLGQCGRQVALELGLLRIFQRVVDLDSEVPDRAFRLHAVERQLKGPPVLGSRVDERRFGAPRRVGSVGRPIQSSPINSVMGDPRMLAGRNMQRPCPTGSGRKLESVIPICKPCGIDSVNGRSSQPS